MNDLISRQAAIDELERKKDKNAKGDIGGFYNKIIQNDIDALMQLPSAQPESSMEECACCVLSKPEQRWIPVEERLPKAYEDCLWTTTDGRVFFTIVMGCFRNIQHGCHYQNHTEQKGEPMTVKDLITRLLDEPMDAEILLQTNYDKPVESYNNNVRSITSGIAFDIDSVERWASNRILINFTDWREDGEANE